MLCHNFVVLIFYYLILCIFITDNVLEIIELTSKTDDYSEPNSTISNISMVREIVKRCGFKSNIIANPNVNKKLPDDQLKDAFKR